MRKSKQIEQLKEQLEETNKQLEEKGEGTKEVETEEVETVEEEAPENPSKNKVPENPKKNEEKVGRFAAAERPKTYEPIIYNEDTGEQLTLYEGVAKILNELQEIRKVLG